jgi:predicted nuclease with TOPRIM domain
MADLVINLREIPEFQQMHEDMREIKGSLKELVKGVAHLALVDERIANLIKMDLKMSDNLEAYEDRLRKLELLAMDSQRTNVWVERCFIAVVGAAMMFVAKAVGLI